jgi:hypothetical protein
MNMKFKSQFLTADHLSDPDAHQVFKLWVQNCVVTGLCQRPNVTYGFILLVAVPYYTLNQSR